MADLITLNTGDKIKISVGIENGTDGWSGEYTVHISIYDKTADKFYYLKKSSNGYYFDESGTYTDDKKIKETISAGTSTVLSYTAVVPDTNEITIQGNVALYDGDTFVVGTNLMDAYKYRKKKYSMTIQVSWEKA